LILAARGIWEGSSGQAGEDSGETVERAHKFGERAKRADEIWVWGDCTAPGKFGEDEGERGIRKLRASGSRACDGPVDVRRRIGGFFIFIFFKN
jgi:hypothetical protein